MDRTGAIVAVHTRYRAAPIAVTMVLKTVQNAPRTAPRTSSAVPIRADTTENAPDHSDHSSSPMAITIGPKIPHRHLAAPTTRPIAAENPAHAGTATVFHRHLIPPPTA